MGYKHKINFVRDEKGAMLADSHSILNTWKDHWSIFECTWG